METRLEEARNREIIDKALMTKDPLELSLAAIKTTIKGDKIVKKLTLNRAIINYFKERLCIDISF